MAARDRGYPPFNVLKDVAEDVWLVDAEPLHKLGLDIPIRMTVVRLANGETWLHSPTHYDPGLRRAIEMIGPIGHLVAPNIAHWAFIKDWHEHCPGATTWAAPKLRQRRQVKKSGVVLDHDLGMDAPREWRDDIQQLIVPGGFGVNEVVFFHSASRTLVLTDLIENFERDRVGPIERILVGLAGALAPDGRAPGHLRFAINRKRKAAAAAVRQMLLWEPARVIFAHGAWFDQDASQRLNKSFSWLVD